jgi:hypothetical protein
MQVLPQAKVQAAPASGAVNTYFGLTKGTTLSVDMQPLYGEDGYHFYSLSPFFQGLNYGMYTGIQTNGNLGNGGPVGNMFIFSVWNATKAFPASGATAVPFDGEGIGYSLRKAYNWQVGQTYKVTLKREAFDMRNNGYRWSATIKNKASGESLRLGEIVAPRGADSLETGSVFHERYTGTEPVCDPSGSNLEKAGVRFTNISSNKPVSFYNSPYPNNLFADPSCAPYIHSFNSTTQMVSGFGISTSEFNTLLP